MARLGKKREQVIELPEWEEIRIDVPTYAPSNPETVPEIAPATPELVPATVNPATSMFTVVTV